MAEKHMLESAELNIEGLTSEAKRAKLEDKQVATIPPPQIKVATFLKSLFHCVHIPAFYGH